MFYYEKKEIKSKKLCNIIDFHLYFFVLGNLIYHNIVTFTKTLIKADNETYEVQLRELRTQNLCKLTCNL